MKDKQFDAARNNEVSPAPGLAAVNTHNPTEEAKQPAQSTNAQPQDEREKAKKNKKADEE